MATKSILKNVVVSNRLSGRRLVSALENAKGKSSQEVKLSRTVQRIGKDKIKDFFGHK